MSLAWTIELDARALGSAGAELEQRLIAGVDALALQAAQAVQAIWVAEAQRMRVRETGAYIAGLQGDGSVRVRRRADGASSFLEAIVDVVATAPHSIYVEDGHRAFHLPDVVDWSGGRVKFNKKGEPYMHIPFRHTAFASASRMDAQGYTTSARKRMMPDEVYAQARVLARTIRLKVGPVTNPDGSFRQADMYTQGGRLRQLPRTSFIMSAGGGLTENWRDERKVGPRGGATKWAYNPAWSASKFEGLFKGGPKGHSEYMTIRTMTRDSPGWWIPAVPGTGLARRVASVGPQFVGPVVEAGLRGLLEAV